MVEDVTGNVREEASRGLIWDPSPRDGKTERNLTGHKEFGKRWKEPQRLDTPSADF
jgi:hypothetical protein